MVKKRKRKGEPSKEAPDFTADEIRNILSTPKTSLLNVGYDGAKVAISLMDSTTQQAIQRHGWFRLSSQLRHKIDDFKDNYKLYRKAQKLIEARQGNTMAKPSHEEIREFEDALVAAVVKAQTRREERPMNHKRNNALAKKKMLDKKTQKEFNERRTIKTMGKTKMKTTKLKRKKIKSSNAPKPTDDVAMS
eukprot:GEMP01060434.1.p1 GENE.GEMP01060434.1~~GEMP01060434.1.p1  ORF type:complete len:191 (+),score=44.87 GEMP01060434.1:69-641(+)